MWNNMTSNNVTRLLDSRKIPYKVFTLPTEKLGAEETAAILDIPASIVFKSIVVKRDKPGKPIIAVIPGDREVDLKLLAAAVGEKKVNLPTQVEAEKLTGLQAGGISPLALINRGFQVIIDISAEALVEIHISGGQRGLNILLPVADLIELTHAKMAAISNPK
jgi:Cys-tRNA(Pro)/Cys-tRNA(Cys) deacylase